MAALKLKPGMVVEWWVEAVSPFAQRHAVVRPLCANAGDDDEKRKKACSCSRKTRAAGAAGRSSR